VASIAGNLGVGTEFKATVLFFCVVILHQSYSNISSNFFQFIYFCLCEELFIFLRISLLSEALFCGMPL